MQSTIMLRLSSQCETSVMRVRLRVVKKTHYKYALAHYEYTLVERTRISGSVNKHHFHLVHICNGLVHIHNGLVHIHNGLVHICNGLVCIRNGLVHIHNGFLWPSSLTLITEVSHWELKLRSIRPSPNMGLALPPPWKSWIITSIK